MNDHGIWQEENIWKSVLQKVLNQKFQEAVQKEKEKKQQNGEESGDPDEYKQMFNKASNFMWGKTFKGSLWGGQSGSGSQSARGEGDKKKPQTMRIPKSLA